MIYIKEGSTYFKYHLSDDNRLICTEKGKSEYAILHDISGEFDGIITPDNNIHMILQNLSGDLLYLKKESETWKKFSILKTRKGIQKISCIRIASSENTLCAFYVISHQGKNLLVKHVFSCENMFAEPEVIGVIGGRPDFVLADEYQKETAVIYKTADGEYIKQKFDKNFKICESRKLNLEPGILMLNAIFVNEKLYFVYTVQRKNSVALVFCTDNQADSVKIITFGIARNSAAQIIFKDGFLIIQWNENGTILQSDSSDDGKTFSKPKHLSGECRFAKIRQPKPETSLICNVCAVYNMEPYVYHSSHSKAISKKDVTKPLNTNKHSSKEFDANITNEHILKKLNEIQSEIDKMEKNLIKACAFLEDVKIFKFKAEHPHNKTDAPATLQAQISTDIGEINEDNLKLFENTDIDTILPDKNKSGEVIL